MNISNGKGESKLRPMRLFDRADWTRKQAVRAPGDMARFQKRKRQIIRRGRQWITLTLQLRSMNWNHAGSVTELKRPDIEGIWQRPRMSKPNGSKPMFRYSGYNRAGSTCPPQCYPTIKNIQWQADWTFYYNITKGECRAIAKPNFFT